MTHVCPRAPSAAAAASRWPPTRWAGRQAAAARAGGGRAQERRRCPASPAAHAICPPTATPLQPATEVWLVSEFCNRGPLLTAIERGAFLTQPSSQYGQPNLISVLQVGGALRGAAGVPAGLGRCWGCAPLGWCKCLPWPWAERQPLPSVLPSPASLACVQTLQEVAAALQYLHRNDVLHGDLTGGNVLLTASDKDTRGFTAKARAWGIGRRARQGRRRWTEGPLSCGPCPPTPPTPAPSCASCAQVVDFGLSRVCSGDYLRTRTLGCAEYM